MLELSPVTNPCPSFPNNVATTAILTMTPSPHLLRTLLISANLSLSAKCFCLQRKGPSHFTSFYSHRADCYLSTAAMLGFGIHYFCQRYAISFLLLHVSVLRLMKS